MSLNPYNRTIRQTEPVSESITLTQVKDQLRIDDAVTIDDDLLNLFIAAARSRCESYANRFFASADFIVLFDDFGDDSTLVLPYPDSTVSSITYLDADKTTQTFTDFTFDSDFQEIIPDSTFPVGSNVKVSITSGADYTKANQSMLLYVSDYYEVRTAEKSKRNYAAEMGLDQLRVEMGV